MSTTIDLSLYFDLRFPDSPIFYLMDRKKKSFLTYDFTKQKLISVLNYFVRFLCILSETKNYFKSREKL